MLKFDRKSFKSGIQIVKEPDSSEGAPEGALVVYTFKPSDKGKNFEFLNDSYILSKYPVLFSAAE